MDTQETVRKLYSDLRIIKASHTGLQLIIDAALENAEQAMKDSGLDAEIAPKTEVNIFGAGNSKNPVI